MWIGVPTGILLAADAFLGALGEFGGHMKSGCEATGYCATAKPTPPVVPNYTSPWVNSGHNTSEYCGPQTQHYRAIYPAFNVTWTALGEGRDNDWRGHATYQYNCAFEAMAKWRRRQHRDVGHALLRLRLRLAPPMQEVGAPLRAAHWTFPDRVLAGL